MKTITHLQLHQSVRASFVHDEACEASVNDIEQIVEATLEELGLDVANGLIVEKQPKPARRKR